MAYAALVSLEQTIDKILNDHDKYPIYSDGKQQLKSTHENIVCLKHFLEEFPEKASSLEERIRDAADKAEDITEHFMSKQIRRYYILKSTARPESVKRWLHSDFKKSKKILEEIDSIAREVMETKNTDRAKDVQVSESFSVAASSSRLVPATSKDAMVGFEEDLMAIKARLCGESQNLEVIPILGMGGIGKTTLASNAYTDPLTVEHFDVSVWVTVSQHYSAQEILSGLLVSIKKERSGRSIGSMAETVYQHLKGRRYLIVMDDIWSTEAWDDVKMIFPDDYNGSRIMLTTRLFDVAVYPDSSSALHEMHFMDADQSWNLFHQKVFCPPELETTGKIIVRSCRGLPLAIVVIAGLLSTVSKTQASWKNIAENVNEAIIANDEQFPKTVLSLSYNHLPHHLRPCFLYMGAFREDDKIDISKLTKLWVAEGFLKPSGSKCFEEVAEEYLEDLVKRSLVLVIKRKTNGKIKSCSLHDLVRDLCIRKAEEEKFILNITMHWYVPKTSLENIIKRRRVMIAHFDMEKCLEYIDGSTIHTVICFNYCRSVRSLGTFRLLRVLDVLAAHIMFFTFVSLPAEVFELFHLRYLAFMCGEQFVLPPSILNLQNLQTLIIQPRKILRSELELLFICLPMEIWKMPQLRHLLFLGPLPNIPQGGSTTFTLENLQTISEVINLRCTEEILKMIPNLKKLRICYVGNEYVEDYHLDNLVYLHRLENLKLNLHYNFRGKLINPVFPTTMKKLTLDGPILPWKDMSNVIGSLPNLEVLKLRNFFWVGEIWETSEGEFPLLKFLLINGSDLEQWITESSHFPRLKCLVIYACHYLSEIPDDIGEIPTLELIEIDDQNKSLVESAKLIQEEQQSCENDALQVRVVNKWRK